MKNGKLRNNFNAWNVFITNHLSSDEFRVKAFQYGKITACRWLQIGDFESSNKGSYVPPHEPPNLPRIRNLNSLRQAFRTAVADVLSSEAFQPLNGFQDELGRSSVLSTEASAGTPTRTTVTTPPSQQPTTEWPRRFLPHQGSIPLSEEEEFVRASLENELLPLLFRNRDRRRCCSRISCDNWSSA